MPSSNCNLEFRWLALIKHKQRAVLMMSIYLELGLRLSI